MSDQSPDATVSPVTTTSYSPQPQSFGSSHWVVTAIGKLGAYAMVAPVAWQLPSLLREEGWVGILAAALVMAVAAPTALKDLAAVIQARAGGGK